MNHVPGTWSTLPPSLISPTSSSSSKTSPSPSALMFVYPREGALVKRYVNLFFPPSTSTSVHPDPNPNPKPQTQIIKHDNNKRQIIWLGPKSDWPDTGFGSFPADDAFEVLEYRHGVGLEEWEMLGVLRPRR
ncbi:hypothetical protein F5Y17DRAFT_412921 [Xylariaceae sp. FL0594]|nr:hypothetical protein F5Y17DRAFT_412921 [Xylariaceae sp. FL0594]